MSLIVAGEFKELELEDQKEALVHIMKCIVDEGGMSYEMIDSIQERIDKVNDTYDGFFGIKSPEEVRETMAGEVECMLGDLEHSGTESIFTKELEDAHNDLEELMNEFSVEGIQKEMDALKKEMDALKKKVSQKLARIDSELKSIYRTQEDIEEKYESNETTLNELTAAGGDNVHYATNLINDLMTDKKDKLTELANKAEALGKESKKLAKLMNW